MRIHVLHELDMERTVQVWLGYTGELKSVDNHAS